MANGIIPEISCGCYGEYAHGNPKKQHVILERSLLGEANNASNIPVRKHDLLERFVKTVADDARRAKENSETLVILISAHGLGGNRAVEIGDGPTNKNDKQNNLLLDRFKQPIPRGVNATLLSTECYSSAWFVEPHVNHPKGLD